MKETITSLAVFMAISLAAAVVWAGGMGGGMMGGGGGHMMHSYGHRQMRPEPDHRGHNDQYHGQRRFDDRDRQQWGGGNMMNSYDSRQMRSEPDHRGYDDRHHGQRRFDDRQGARRDNDLDRRQLNR